MLARIQAGPSLPHYRMIVSQYGTLGRFWLSLGASLHASWGVGANHRSHVPICVSVCLSSKDKLVLLVTVDY